VKSRYIVQSVSAATNISHAPKGLWDCTGAKIRKTAPLALHVCPPLTLMWVLGLSKWPQFTGMCEFKCNRDVFRVIIQQPSL
jgi:hypothetical protein